jgi:hypothetical protein
LRTGDDVPSASASARIAEDTRLEEEEEEEAAGGAGGGGDT